jgi:two-component system CheB/CheR fusion protein
MPQRLLEYYGHAKRLRLPPEEGPQPAQVTPAKNGGDEEHLREVLAFLRRKSGCDFSYYKRATIVRRIARRLQVNGMENLADYLSFLRLHPGESGALLQDLLISVTNFFRDRDAFQALESFIPELFKGKGPGDFVRVWSPACATGEEAYSLAMLLLEHAQTLDQPPAIQVFGCDLSQETIQFARMGLYPETITADLSEERIKRFFVKEAAGHRIRREVRELMLFATHDLLKDPPFSRMDLISCRNLMIYLDSDAQKRVLDTFHFALRPQGLLFLGASETVPEESALFTAIDKKHRIFRHQSTQTTSVPAPLWPNTLLRALEVQDKARVAPVLPGRTFNQGMPTSLDASFAKPHLPPGELHFRLLERYATPSVLVNREYDVVHLSENARRFLQFAAGELTINLLRLVDPVLRPPLRSALFQATESESPVQVSNLSLPFEGATRALTLRVLPAGDLEPGFLLIEFDLGPAAKAAVAPSELRADEPVVRQLEKELEVTKARLRNREQQHEAHIEEMKAGNEELQAMNEELRSASEELETSREELQSINEELSTVNLELKSKLDELSHAHSDLHNLMASTAIPIVFLNRDLQIELFTPSATGIFRIIPGDVGRLLSDLQHQLIYPELIQDAQHVLETLIPVEREVSDLTERYYFARILPYRTLEDRIGGVVLAFLDITERIRAEQSLRQSEALTRQAKEQLERQSAELERLVNEKTESLQQAVFQMEEFSYTISHDLRAPLRAMQQFSQALLEDYGDRFEAEGKDYLERINAAAKRMEDLTRDVLAYSKVTKDEAHPEPVSLHAVVSEIMRLSPSLSSAVTVEGTLPTVMGEKPLLSQAISNLLNNAVKFVRPGVPAKIRIWHELRGRRIRLWIEDNGIGIDPALAGRLFRPFERIHPERAYEGTGIGLAITRKAVERMTGQVGVESDGQTGSRFWIELIRA